MMTLQPPGPGPLSNAWAPLAFAALLMSAGCTASHKGLVELEAAARAVPGTAGPGTVRLRTPEGRSFALRSPDEIEILRALSGCTIQVSGAAMFGSLVVQDWTVIEAGDGSAPYVGTLRQHGSNVVIDDRHSGMPLVLDEFSAARFGSHTGQVVMISGYVVGAQLLHVVNFRVLVE